MDDLFGAVVEEAIADLEPEQLIINASGAKPGHSKILGTDIDPAPFTGCGQRRQAPFATCPVRVQDVS
jgi:hypothetical protein